ncbi:MAG: enoyl-CoA hydratase/isomerase family protein, partial [Candidatus Acidiferrales bacterium]
MAYENILFDVKDQIARITFNRPAVLNALNRPTMEELGDCLNRIRADASIRVVILT